MPRGPRLLVPGAYYHVYGRGNRRQRTYLDDDDRRVFLDRLVRIAVDSGAEIVAHCLMPNHFHLLVRPGPRGLADLMHRLLCSYANWFNRRHGTVGHLYQGRYGSRPLETVGDVLVVLRYIHLNPVAAGLVADPWHWPWSSHGMHLQRHPPEAFAPGIERLRRELGPTPGIALRRYRELMTLPCPRDEEVFRRVDVRPAGRTVAPVRSAPPTLGIEALLNRVAWEHGTSRDALIGASKLRTLALARREFVRRASLDHGIPLRLVAEALGRTAPCVSRMMSTPDPGVEAASRRGM